MRPPLGAHDARYHLPSDVERERDDDAHEDGLDDGAARAGATGEQDLLLG